MTTTPPPRYVELAGELGTLRGFWHPPATDTIGTAGDGAHYPTVVMLHGLSGSSDSNGYLFVGQARRLAAAGIGSLRVDFFGSANSDGEHSAMTIWTELSDAQRIFEYAISQAGVDTARMGVIGYSFGGGIAALLTGVEPRIQALVGWSPAVDPRGGAAFAAAPKPLSFGGLLLSDAFVQSMMEARPLDALSRFTGPTLVVHGDADETVSMGSGALFAEKTGGRLVLVNGANHGYEHPTWREELYTETTRHFVEHLRG
jgi:hypothetical protein